MSERKPKPLHQLAQDALDVQDACNLSGVAISFAQVMKDLCHHCTGGTQERNHHPIAQLWACKIADLTGHPSYDQDRYGDAWTACHDIVLEERRLREADELTRQDLEAAGEFFDNLQKKEN